jgi:hypothetical protein
MGHYIVVVLVIFLFLGGGDDLKHIPIIYPSTNFWPIIIYYPDEYPLPFISHYISLIAIIIRVIWLIYVDIPFWLVVSTPPKNMSSSVGMFIPFPTNMENHKSHVNQTANQ